MSVHTESIPVGDGVVLGFGGTNARVARSSDGDISDFRVIDTPDTPPEFFDWTARQILEAADNGAKWVVAGFPGPVSADGAHIGPFNNISGMNRQHCLHQELITADPAVREVFDLLPVIAVNDGELAAHAAARRVGHNEYQHAGALILGTGCGLGTVRRDDRFADVYRADRRLPTEIGHVTVGLFGGTVDVQATPENALAGPALARAYGEDARDLPAHHEAWERVGVGIARLGLTTGLLFGVDLMVPCGGVGAGAFDKYKSHLERALDDMRRTGSEVQRSHLPRILRVPEADVKTFEMFGGEGVARDYFTAQTAAIVSSQR